KVSSRNVQQDPLSCTSGSLLLDWLAPPPSNTAADAICSASVSSTDQLLADLAAAVQYA
ncbi:hypothetical protein CU098_008875, partial [Rhizopus stolonifer]